MASVLEYLIDTNILLRLFRKDDPLHDLIKATLSGLNSKGSGLYFSLQNIAEFWNVCTRPTERNGYALSSLETNRCVAEIERTMSFLADSAEVYSTWRRIVADQNVRGVQVHDARLVAIMKVYGLTRILTLNQADFLRYPEIQSIHPDQVQASAR